MLGNRKPFRNAISQGIAVTELPSTRDNTKAQSELAMLFRGLCALTRSKRARYELTLRSN